MNLERKNIVLETTTKKTKEEESVFEIKYCFSIEEFVRSAYLFIVISHITFKQTK